MKFPYTLKEIVSIRNKLSIIGKTLTKPEDIVDSLILHSLLSDVETKYRAALQPKRTTMRREGGRKCGISYRGHIQRYRIKKDNRGIKRSCIEAFTDSA